MAGDLKIDEVGYWTEVKLSILEEYARPYNQILLANNLRPIYIDGFAGAGHHKARRTGQVIEGSPARALGIKPPFEFLHLVDIDGARAAELKRLSLGRQNVSVYEGDCNDVLTSQVFPKISYANRHRALCILDPYGLHLNWETIQIAGRSKVIEIFLNFPVMDMNMNVLWHDPTRVPASQLQRMNAFWGDSSWQEAAYETTRGLFEDFQIKTSNDQVAEAFRVRLKEQAGFERVPKPMPMRNSRGAVVYYLFFAAQKLAADKIVTDIFAKYEHRGE